MSYTEAIPDLFYGETIMSSNEVSRRNYVRVNQAEPPTTSSPLGEASMDFVFGRLWDSPGLSWRERRLISLTCTAISGHALPLETHVRGALKSGDFTVEELRAFSVHLAAYAGFPVAAGVEMMLQKVLADKPGS
jgi:4-carboxymuconolactone decarboxylase